MGLLDLVGCRPTRATGFIRFLINTNVCVLNICRHRKGKFDIRKPNCTFIKSNCTFIQQMVQYDV